VGSLARAFFHAGCRGVVCSLWAVDDAGTAELMQSFYKGLKDGKPTAEALRRAKLAMIEANRPPFLWAPFVHLGQ
jgi:CHAT domain-containing protein